MGSNIPCTQKIWKRYVVFASEIYGCNEVLYEVKVHTDAEDLGSSQFEGIEFQINHVRVAP